jgi:hypothetical protein
LVTIPPALAAVKNGTTGQKQFRKANRAQILKAVDQTQKLFAVASVSGSFNI